ncbi:MAG: peptide deformylase [Candidatus Dojkabacteria bacterium]|nr:peptide deformylase [Candidatus Dojkabacteria bacterium]
MRKKFNKILQYPDPKLKLVSKEITSIDADVIRLLDDLERLCRKTSKDVLIVGLSAVQVGWNVRVFVAFDLNKDRFIRVINPKVVELDEKQSTIWEGCASVGTGENSLFGPVKRPMRVVLEFLDDNGKPNKKEFKNEMSHIILHEMDHLDGIIFLERVEDHSKIITAKELDRYMALHDGQMPPVD